MNTITDNIKKELELLFTDNDQLIRTCEFALENLNNITTEEFSLGKDKEIRRRLENSIELHQVYSQKI